jgi:hypothetical protein
LSPENIGTYIESLSSNHYDRQLILGEIKTAHALSDNGEVLYEVVYSTIVDNIKLSPSKVSTIVGDVYPNSLNNMRNAVINKVGQISKELPRWMLSKQANGNILGFTDAWVIAYTLPGQSKSIAYNIKTEFGQQLNKINFIADRYTFNSQFTKNWNANDQRWYPTDSTSFDIYNHGISAGTNNVTVDANTYTIDLVNPIAIETSFDNTTCRFIDIRSNKTDITIETTDTIDISADNGIKNAFTTYNITNKFDKYLIFPSKDIINIK